MYVPHGWYVVQRATGNGDRHFRLGLYCTLSCLIDSHRRLQQGHAEHAERLGLPADEIDRPAALLRQVFTLMHDRQLSIRQTGDVLGLPTDTVREWLRIAQIATDDTGRLALSKPPPMQRPTQTVKQFLAEREGAQPVTVVNELAQAGYIHPPGWDVAVTGPSHQPSFTATLTVIIVHSKILLAATGTAASKAAARSAAAAALFCQLASAAPQPPPLEAEQQVPLADGEHP